jgi:FKBP-type peptidyl-prolyl cis-trans isomerase
MARALLLSILLCATLALHACGGGSSAKETSEAETTNAAKPAVKRSCGPQLKSIASNELGEPGPEKMPEPDIRPPCGPPPKKLVVVDLKEGSGHAASPGDEIAMRYVGADYQTGEETYGSWFREGIAIELGAKTRTPGLEIGLRGMKVGGRRELIVPASLAEGHGPLIYIIDLLKVKPG